MLRMQTGRLVAAVEVCLIKPWNVLLTNVRIIVTSVRLCKNKAIYYIVIATNRILYIHYNTMLFVTFNQTRDFPSGV